MHGYCNKLSSCFYDSKITKNVLVALFHKNYQEDFFLENVYAILKSILIVDKKTAFFIYAFFAPIFLLAGLSCILIFENLKNYTDYLNLAQSLSVYAMIFLSIGLFYESNTQAWEKTPIIGTLLKFLGKCCLLAFVFLILIILIISQGKILTPIFMTLVALGLFCSTRFFNTKFEPDELEDLKKTLHFFEMPLGRLVLFIIALAIMGIIFAGFPFIIEILI